jgi:hypothetical protein
MFGETFLFFVFLDFEFEIVRYRSIVHYRTQLNGRTGGLSLS